MSNDQSAGKSNSSGTLTVLRKELVIPILVSVISGIALATYQNYLSKDNTEPAKIDTTQQIKSIETPQTADPKVLAAQQRAQEIELLKQTLADYRAQAEQLLAARNCDQAKEMINKIAWPKPELDENHSLELQYERVRRDLAGKLSFCGMDEALIEAKKDAEKEVLRRAKASINRQYSNVDMTVTQEELIEAPDKYGNDILIINYHYRMKGEGSGGQSKNFDVLVKCSIPILDGKPGEPNYGTPEIFEIQ